MPVCLCGPGWFRHDQMHRQHSAMRLHSVGQSNPSRTVTGTYADISASASCCSLCINQLPSGSFNQNICLAACDTMNWC